MAYKISDKAILVESGGENILIAETATFERGGLTLLDSDFTLSPTFVTNYFRAFQGVTSGYASGGNITGPSKQNIIDKFPFSSDANATDVGDLTQGRYLLAGGQSSGTHGYSSGGYIVPDVNVIDKFTFSADFKATDVGDLTQARYGTGGAGVQG